MIPQNTGSIARLCACTNTRLHLIHPLGFKTDESAVKRAGLDYWNHVDIHEHENWEAFLTAEKPKKLAFLSKFATKNYFEAELSPPLYLVLGNETEGLPELIRKKHEGSLYKLPMRTHLVRSLNLAQCAGIIVYEALRQAQFNGLIGHGHVEHTGLQPS